MLFTTETPRTRRYHSEIRLGHYLLTENQIGDDLVVLSSIVMQRIVFVERNTFNIEFPRPSFAHEWIEFGETTQDQIVPRLLGASIVICNKLQLRREVLSQLGDLKLIAVAATGVDNIELDRSSGLKVLDAAAFKIVKMASPFAAFPANIRRDTDLLVITRTWFFSQGDKIWTE